MSDHADVSATPLPETATRSAREYFAASKKGDSLFNFILDLALRADYVSHIAEKALEGSYKENDPDAMTPSDLAKEKPGPTIKALRQMKQELLELFFESAVNNFETLPFQLCARFFAKRPKSYGRASRISLSSTSYSFNRFRS